MRINSINCSNINSLYINKTKNKPAHKTCSNTNISFTSVVSSALPQNQHLYVKELMKNKDFQKIKIHSTRPFRELPTELKLISMLNPDKKTRINILGCSDGSEAYAYAIALNEAWGKKAKENVTIKGVDNAPYMIELAKTGKLSCADVEKFYADNSPNNKLSSSPLKHEGWDKYLSKTSRPENFSDLVNCYPFLRYMEKDPVAGITLGRGINWYKVNKQDLPKITFETGDMMAHTTSTKDVDAEVYVIANSAGYLLVENPDSYIYFFNNIKNANKDTNKDIYVVTGELENTMLNTPVGNQAGISRAKQEVIKDMIDFLGFRKISTDVSYTPFKSKPENNIYKLEN